MRRKWIRWSLVGVIVLVVAGGAWWWSRQSSNAQPAFRYTDAVVTRGTVQRSIQADGSFVHAEETAVQAPSVGGTNTVKAVYVQTGQSVKKGEPLFQLANADLEHQIEQERINVQKALLTLAATLNVPPEQAMVATLPGEAWVTAPAAGRVQTVSVAEGAPVNSTEAAMATLVDDRSILFIMDVSESQMRMIQVGQKAQVVVDSFTPEPVPAQVQRVDRSGTPGPQSMLYRVELQVPNPGLIKDGMTGQATIHSASGDVTQTGTFALPQPVSVTAPQTGTVGTVLVEPGQWVEAGARLLSVRSSSADQTSVNQQRLAVQSAQLTLDDDLQRQGSLRVTAPSDGVVTTVNVEAGDTLGGGSFTSGGSSASGAGSSTGTTSAGLVVISTAGTMELKAAVNEVDVPYVRVGQAVTVSAVAFPQQTLPGTVSSIADQGVNSGSTATFDVSIRVNEPGPLRAGMTGHAEIVVDTRQGVLRVPTEAVVQPQGGLSATAGEGFVRLLAGNRVVQQRVELGLVTPEWTEIRSGLEEGSRVILATSLAGQGNIFMFGGPSGGGNGENGAGGSRPGGDSVNGNGRAGAANDGAGAAGATGATPATGASGGGR